MRAGRVCGSSAGGATLREGGERSAGTLVIGAGAAKRATDQDATPGLRRRPYAGWFVCRLNDLFVHPPCKSDKSTLLSDILDTHPSRVVVATVSQYTLAHVSLHKTYMSFHAARRRQARPTQTAFRSGTPPEPEPSTSTPTRSSTRSRLQRLISNASNTKSVYRPR